MCGVLGGQVCAGTVTCTRIPLSTIVHAFWPHNLLQSRNSAVCLNLVFISSLEGFIVVSFLTKYSPFDRRLQQVSTVAYFSFWPVLGKEDSGKHTIIIKC